MAPGFPPFGVCARVIPPPGTRFLPRSTVVVTAGCLRTVSTFIRLRPAEDSQIVLLVALGTGPHGKQPWKLGKPLGPQD